MLYIVGKSDGSRTFCLSSTPSLYGHFSLCFYACAFELHNYICLLFLFTCWGLREGVDIGSWWKCNSVNAREPVLVSASYFLRFWSVSLACRS